MGSAQNLGVSTPIFNYQSQSPTGPANALQDFFTGSDTVNNAYNWDAMNEQNKFNEFMSDTTYQRSVSDMLKAGINPMIAFSQGAGSAKISSPTSAGIAPSNFDKSGGLLGNMFGTAVKSFASSLGMSGNKQGAAMMLGKLIG